MQKGTLWQAHPIASPKGLRGAALHEGNVYLWGDGLYRVPVNQGPAQRLASGSFGPAGCLYDGGIVLQSGEDLVFLAAPRFDRPRRIDSGVDAADCQAARLLGHNGVLVTHRGLQVRHYTPPEDSATRWPYREIYSFYTASYQAGLIVSDVDGDGRPDLFCGNYWIRSPEAYELPWRLFAINTWNEEPLSARVRLALMGRSLVVAQGAMRQARLAVFDRPADPTQLWKEHRLESEPPPRQPQALAAGPDFFVLGESAGPDPRLMLWRRHSAGGFRMSVIHRGTPFTSVWVLDRGILAFGPGGLMRFEGSPIQ